MVAKTENMFYNPCMDISLQTMPLNKLVVLALPRYKARDIFPLMADLAVKGAIRVVDGGNLFNVLILNRMIRYRTDNVNEVLKRIYISRAFTCYQMTAMLQNLSSDHGPVFVLDLLNTFYDESVDDEQSRRLLTNSIRTLKKLSSVLPVLVSISPPPKQNRRPFLMKMLLNAANTVWQSESEAAPSAQPTLWE